MKELTVEQKANRYDEIIKKANKMHHENCEACQMCIEELFPELAESNDEKIRKEMIEILKKEAYDFPSSVIAEKSNSWIAYLEKRGQTFTKKDVDDAYLKGISDTKNEFEKQGEQKLAEIIPKFKVDDFIVNNNSRGVCQVTEIRDDEYCLYPLYGEIMGYLRIIDVDNEYHLWTIQDAKDGDVLSYMDGRNNIWVCIFKEYTNERVYDYCTLDKESFWERSNWNYLASFNYAPATKEQRDLLFLKMKEAEYMWDADKKELKKISQEYPLTPDECIKPAWSEEDEKVINDIMWIIEAYRKNGFNKKHIQMADSSEKWIKSLKERVQPKIEWSEEDEDAIGMAIIALEDRYDSDAPSNTYVGYTMSFNKAIERLKSLIPQPQWKPSDEQMETLKFASGGNYVNLGVLESLYQDLKKLKGE